MYIDLLSNVNRKFDDPPNIRPSAPPNKTGHCTHFKGWNMSYLLLLNTYVPVEPQWRIQDLVEGGA